MWLLLAGVGGAQSIAQKYPSYPYVFSEFDVEDDFVNNSEFVAFVKRNEGRFKRFYRASIRRGERLLPLMQRTLMADGLSDLLIYLSMVESGFAVDAVSSKKAVGLWQFMPATAKHYKLIVQGSIDERYDPQSATDAAVAYLMKLFEKFGKWYLAMMAYNCGEGRLQRAIDTIGSDALDLLIAKSSPLPRETRHYIQKILLVAMIGENISIGFEKKYQQRTHNNGRLRVVVKGGESWSKLAQLLEMNTTTLRGLNPAYKNDRLPNQKAHYDIYIPEEKVYAFYLRYDLEEASSAPPVTESAFMLSHIVALGETLEGIAQKYHSDPKRILAINHKKDEYLELGELLVIPVDREQLEGTQSDKSGHKEK